jgi:protein-tyrosine phosphatase
MSYGISKILGDVTCVYISGSDVASNLSILTEYNITHIINCAKEVPNYFEDKFKYLNLNLADSTPVGFDDNIMIYKDSVLDFINDCILNKGHLLFYCCSGISRSVSIAIMYIMLKFNVSFDFALMCIKNKRHIANPIYIEQLKTLEHLKKGLENN